MIFSPLPSMRRSPQTLSFSGNAFIDGGFRPAASGRTFPTVNPAPAKR